MFDGLDSFGDEQYLKMIREAGAQEWIWAEMRDLNAMLFRFKEKEKPQALVTHLASCLHVSLEDYKITLHVGANVLTFNTNTCTCM